MGRRFWRKKSRTTPAERDRKYHEDFANKIIKQIEAGVAPWQKPWKPGENVLPENFKTGQSYSGGNSLYLSATATERGYSDNRWGTYRQIQAAGGYVRKGEKGTTARWISHTFQKRVKDKQGKPVKDADGKQVYRTVELDRPFVKRFTVYNVEQTEKLKLPDRQERQAAWKTHDAAERVIRGSGVDFRHQSGDRAGYQMKTDRVTMPERAQFPDADRYYQTAMHELGHATGHHKRLNRESLQDAVKSNRGSRAYAREELRAEIAGMMTNTRLGVGHNPRHGAAYVENWVRALKEEPKEIRAAASEAQRMSSFLIERGRDRAQRDAQAQPATEAGPSGLKRSRGGPAPSNPSTQPQEASREKSRDDGRSR